MIVFIAAPYRGKSNWEIELNVRRAEEASLAMVELGFSPICVHTMCRFFQNALPDENWISMGLELLAASDCVYFPADCKETEGVTGELLAAGVAGIPVFRTLVDLIQWKLREEEKEETTVPVV